MPLSSRLNTFKQFIAMFEENCLEANEPVKLAIVLFSENKDQQAIQENFQIKDIFYRLKQKYSHDVLHLVELQHKFSRSIGCETGASLFPPSALLFFIDVDMIFTKDFLTRLRLNTIESKQVYFPIVFSQYDLNPGIFGIEIKPNVNEYFRFHSDYGNWRLFGFGMVGVYHSDLKRVGGFNTTIVGWGKEDVDLYDKFAVSNVTVFRSVDPGLVHVFHKITCDPSLSPEQMVMCIGSKTMSILPEKILGNLVHEKKLYNMKNISVG
jgi:chondroitin sulfate synthase